MRQARGGQSCSRRHGEDGSDPSASSDELAAAGANAVGFVGDFSRSAAAHDVVGRALDRWGRLDGVSHDVRFVSARDHALIEHHQFQRHHGISNQSTSTKETEHMTSTELNERVVERHHIDPVPISERSGHPRDLFALWFSANLNIGNAVFGLILVHVVGSFWWALIAALVGNIIGTALMALHSVQGVRLGIPQLIQSRGQFGYFGALVPVAAAALMYAGFTVSVTLVGGQALSAGTGLDVRVAMVVVGCTSLIIALVGYRAIHIVCRYAQLPLAIVVLVVTVAALVRSGAPLTGGGSVTPGSFLTGVGIAVTFALTYAPFVSDYSRYLPVDASGRAIFGWTAAGVFLSAVWVCVLGALLAARFPETDIFRSANDALGNGAFGAIVCVVTAAGLCITNVLNIYGGMLNLITGLATFVRVPVSFRVRLVTILPTFVVGTVVATLVSDNYADNFAAFLSILLLLLIPWGAVNLVDYYLVQHGSYDVPAMYVKTGRYWRNPATWTTHGFNLQVLIAYGAGVAAGLPFVSNYWFVGPFAQALGGADLSWIPGLAVTGAVYLALVALTRRRQSPAAWAAAPMPATSTTEG